MKNKYLLSILFLLFLSNKARSQTINFFDTTGTMIDYNISDVQKITFSGGGDVFVSFYDGEIISIPAEEFSNYQYNQNVLNIDDFNSILNDFELYPNPTQDGISLSFTSQTTLSYNYAIYDVNGRKLMDKIIGLVSGPYVEQVSLTKFSSGVYFLVLKSSKNQISKKIIKK